MAIATTGTDQAGLARSVGAEVAELFRKLVRERLKEILLAQVEDVLDEVLRDLPAEVQSAIALDMSNPFSGPTVAVKVTAGRPR